MSSHTVFEDNATLPSIVDERARTDPERLYGATTWIDDDGNLKLRKITYRDLANSVNSCAKWIESKFGKSSSYTTLAYAGTADYRYLIVTMAAAKTGHRALLLAPWNSKVAQLKLLKECQCDILLAAEDSPVVQKEVKSMQGERNMQVHGFPELNWFLDGPKAPFYPFLKHLDEVRDQDYVIIHTSGSTGHPSPMVYKYGAIAALKNLSIPPECFPAAPKSNIGEVWKNKCHWMALPPCHMGGVLGLGPFNIYWNMPMILSPGDRPITPDITTQIFSDDLCEAAFIPPAYLQAISRNPAQLESVRKLKHILWAGAPWTSSETADAIRSRVEIQAAYGSSEAGPFALILEDQSNYTWTHFHPIMGANLRHFSDDLYELVLEKKSDIAHAQFIFQNFPHLSEWETKDLFSKHPIREDLWRFRGRKDDIIVLANGRNVDPALIEAALAAHSKINAALLCSDGHVRMGLLVEAVEHPRSESEAAALLDEIWPVVERYNEVTSVFGRVQKSMILFTLKGKPFLRAGKGSIQRGPTVRAYNGELKQLFQDVAIESEK